MKTVGTSRAAELVWENKAGQKVLMLLRIALTSLRWLLQIEFWLTGNNECVSNIILRREILLFLLLLIVETVNPRRYCEL